MNFLNRFLDVMNMGSFSSRASKWFAVIVPLFGLLVASIYDPSTVFAFLSLVTFVTVVALVFKGFVDIVADW